MRRSYSGQLLGSVKPAPSGYAGSNPARRTRIKLSGILPDHSMYKLIFQLLYYITDLQGF